MSWTITPEPLTKASFAPFGSVATNASLLLDSDTSKAKGIHANQGTALKFPDVMQMAESYNLAPSHARAHPAISLFTCQPRLLRRAGDVVPKIQRAPSSRYVRSTSEPRTERLMFDVEVLERHPYTSQTFVPMGLSPTEDSTCYLVIVSTGLSENEPKWAGLPDLRAIRAFVARGDQAVTYAGGTWHAPMVVLGSKHVDFVVIQWTNGVPDEDCQEVILEKGSSINAGPVVAFHVPIEEPQHIIPPTKNTPRL